MLARMRLGGSGAPVNETLVLNSVEWSDQRSTLNGNRSKHFAQRTSVQGSDGGGRRAEP